MTNFQNNLIKLLIKVTPAVLTFREVLKECNLQLDIVPKKKFARELTEDETSMTAIQETFKVMDGCATDLIRTVQHLRFIKTLAGLEKTPKGKLMNKLKSIKH